LYLDATALTYEDYVLAVGAGAIVAAVIFALTVLTKYRSLSVQASKSNELAKDLWSALESRLSKQDERIIDLMAKVEIYGVKAENSVNRSVMTEKRSSVAPSSVVAVTNVPTTNLPVKSTGGSTDVETMILQKLTEGPKSSIEIKGIIIKSREHTARLMKSLFDDGYVVRNDRERPFVYEITDVGRRYLTGNRSAGT
jgi:hypothetical protein